MDTENELESHRLETLKEHEFILRPEKADHGPGTMNMAQAAMIAELCAANLYTYSPTRFRHEKFIKFNS